MKHKAAFSFNWTTCLEMHDMHISLKITYSGCLAVFQFWHALKVCFLLLSMSLQMLCLETALKKKKKSNCRCWSLSQKPVYAGMGGKLGPGCVCALLSCASRDPPQLCTINPPLPGYHKVPATASDEPESLLPLVHRLPHEGRASAGVMWGSGEKGLPASGHLLPPSCPSPVLSQKPWESGCLIKVKREKTLIVNSSSFLHCSIKPFFSSSALLIYIYILKQIAC